MVKFIRLTALLVVAALVVHSCNSNKDAGQEKLLQVSRSYIESKLGKDMKIDSCYITGVDIFTALDEAGVYITMKSDSLKSLGALSEALMKKLKVNTDVVKLSYKVSKDLGDKDRETLFSDTTELNALMATRMRLAAEVDSLNKMRTEGKINSTDFVDYRARIQLCISDTGGKQICYPYAVLITKDYQIDHKFGQ